MNVCGRGQKLEDEVERTKLINLTYLIAGIGETIKDQRG